MAKKKVAHPPKDPKQEQPPKKQQQPPVTEPISTSMEYPSSDKLQTLKSLNSRLLKETVEHRQQIESLAADNKTLHAQLAQSGVDNVRLELEKDVFCAYWESQISHMGVGFDGLVREMAEAERVKSEKDAEIGVLRREVNELLGSLESERGKLSLVCQERDSARRDYDGVVGEANGFREIVREMEKRESSMEIDIKNLKMQCSGLLVENEENNRAVKKLTREKDVALGNLVERDRMIESLKRDIEGIVKEKNEIEKEKNRLELRVSDLEKEVEELNRNVYQLKKEAESLQEKIAELEKFIDESKKEREIEVQSLLEEKREKEQSIEMLQVQLDEFTKRLDEVSLEAEDKQRKIKEVTQEKNVIEEARVSQERLIGELRNEICELRDSVFTVRSSLRDQEEKNDQLFSEVGRYKDDLDLITRQRDGIQKDFDEKKMKVEELMLAVSEKEKSIVELSDELQKLRIDNEYFVEKTKSCLESLVQEKNNVQSSLLEAQSKIEEWKAKSEAAGINLERALTMLKNTAALVSSRSELERNGKREVVINEHKLDDNIQPCIQELDAIQNAFKNKEKVLEDMKQQLELLEHSAKDAHKKKNFWTLVSSAITIFAAASVAYVAKGR